MGRGGKALSQKIYSVNCVLAVLKIDGSSLQYTELSLYCVAFICAVLDSILLLSHANSLSKFGIRVHYLSKYSAGLNKIKSIFSDPGVFFSALYLNRSSLLTHIFLAQICV